LPTACALLVFAATRGTAQSPIPAPVSDEKAYTEAMECKVRVEALEMVARDPRERSRLGRVLAHWVQQQRAAGARLSKTPAGMMADEAIFGLAEGSNPESFRQAIRCAQQAEKAPADP
jgi:hypothetical protein